METLDTTSSVNHQLHWEDKLDNIHDIQLDDRTKFGATQLTQPPMYPIVHHWKQWKPPITMVSIG